MNNYVIRKLKEGRTSARLKQSDVALKIGIKPNTLSNYENGVSEPDIDTFCALCNIYRLNPADVLNEAYGLSVQGSDFTITPSEMEHIKKYRSLDESGKKHIDYELDREVKQVKQLQEIKNSPGTPTATIIEIQPHPAANARLTEYFHGALAAGGIFILGSETSEKIPVPAMPENEIVDYVIRVSGDSMEPDYHDGDNVMVSQRLEMQHGDVGIFVVNGKAYIKEYGETELISRNPDFPNIQIAEYGNIVCTGKVVGKLEGTI